MKPSGNPCAGVFLTMLSLLCSPGAPPSFARLTVVSEDYSWSEDDWIPGGGTVLLDGWSSGAGNGRVYSFRAWTYARARMYGYWWAGYGDHGAGGFRRYSWDVDLQTSGSPGSQADIYLDLTWVGSSWAEATVAFANGHALADCSYSFTFLDSEGSPLYHSADVEQIYIQCEGSHFVGPSKTHIDESIDREARFYIGRLPVGDTVSFSGYVESYANAYAPKTSTSVTTQAAMDAFFVLELSAEELPGSSPPGDDPVRVPVASALILVMTGTGLLGMSRRLIPDMRSESV